ncbi:hypothetical protein RRG08_004289 [Elysia crispata]|uniref:Uncharacterized protein n=1 Tax=Elysia crispata TaxID=231223 RepID=A0AAE1CWN3_9GAST|nr:hypothetical protein RRG08_004289 [Elysia crispata]
MYCLRKQKGEFVCKRKPQWSDRVGEDGETVAIQEDTAAGNGGGGGGRRRLDDPKGSFDKRIQAIPWETSSCCLKAKSWLEMSHYE